MGAAQGFCGQLSGSGDRPNDAAGSTSSRYEKASPPDSPRPGEQCAAGRIALLRASERRRFRCRFLRPSERRCFRVLFFRLVAKAVIGRIGSEVRYSLAQFSAEEVSELVVEG